MQIKKGDVERLVIKLPRKLAEYFRKAVHRGKRSGFVAKCIRKYQKNEKFKNFIHRELGL